MYGDLIHYGKGTPNNVDRFSVRTRYPRWARIFYGCVEKRPGNINSVSLTSSEIDTVERPSSEFQGNPINKDLPTKGFISVEDRTRPARRYGTSDSSMSESGR